MGTTTEAKRPNAPYPPYSAFEKFIASMKEKGLPAKVDRSLMSSISGGVQLQLRGALRFFELVSADESPTDLLRRLVDAHNTEHWKSTLADFVPLAYAHITVGLHLDRATTKQVEERFRAAGGLTGSPMVKAIRFYIAINNAAGLKVSPYLKAARQPSPRPRNGDRSAKATGNSGDSPSPPPASGAHGDHGGKEIRIQMPEGAILIRLPHELDEEEMAYAIAQWQSLFALTKRRPKSKS